MCPMTISEEIYGQEDCWTSRRGGCARDGERGASRTDAVNSRRRLESQFVCRAAGTNSECRVAAESGRPGATWSDGGCECATRPTLLPSPPSSSPPSFLAAIPAPSSPSRLLPLLLMLGG